MYRLSPRTGASNGRMVYGLVGEAQAEPSKRCILGLRLVPIKVGANYLARLLLEQKL